MKTLYISYCTEHEFGQRDDGYMVSENLDAMNEKISNSTGDSREQYWTYSPPLKVWCSKKTYKKVMKKKTQNHIGEIAFYGNREKLKLFKKI